MAKKRVPVSELVNYNYAAVVLDALQQYWCESDSFSCIGRPKETNLFLYLDGCEAVYQSKTGKEVYAKSGNIVYTPMNSEYTVRFCNFQSEQSSTIGVNFLLFDEKNLPFILSNDLCAYQANDNRYKFLFDKLKDNDRIIMPNKSRMKAAFYDIIANLGEYYQGKFWGKYSIIADGILYLQNCTAREVSIREVAAMCNVSECYFRRLFKEFSGMTPVEYLTQNKIQKAKTYLRYDHISIGEIAKLLGFVDAAYFTKKFRECTGQTPSAYRKM